MHSALSLTAPLNGTSVRYKKDFYLPNGQWCHPTEKAGSGPGERSYSLQDHVELRGGLAAAAGAVGDVAGRRI
jgi:hypothetical protein